MDWTNVFAAGGAVLGCLAVSQEGYRGSDVDLFIHGILDEQRANQKVAILLATSFRYFVSFTPVHAVYDACSCARYTT